MVIKSYIYTYIYKCHFLSIEFGDLGDNGHKMINLDLYFSINGI